MKPYVRKLLDVSTAHLDPADAQYLDEETVNIVSYKKSGGWFVLALSEDVQPLDDVPASIAAIIRLALENGCEWIEIDADGTVNDVLPIYEW